MLTSRVPVPVGVPATVSCSTSGSTAIRTSGSSTRGPAELRQAARVRAGSRCRLRLDRGRDPADGLASPRGRRRDLAPRIAAHRRASGAERRRPPGLRVPVECAGPASADRRRSAHAYVQLLTPALPVTAAVTLARIRDANNVPVWHATYGQAQLTSPMPFAIPSLVRRASRQLPARRGRRLAARGPRAGAGAIASAQATAQPEPAASRHGRHDRASNRHPASRATCSRSASIATPS